MRGAHDDITITIGGDFAPINQAESVAINSPEKIWGDTLSLFREADLSMVNLETPLTDSVDAIEKTGPHLKADKQCVNALSAAGIGLVTLANNHIFDYGRQGVMDTITVCKNSGIDTVGAGKNLAQARKTYYREIKGKKIAVVNFAENEFSSATDNSAGANPMDLIDNIKQIREAKSNADVVIVIVHGGVEYYRYPTPRMQKQYRFYAEEGADIVVGHHTHMVSGYETHNGVPIFYSLGNLFFPWNNRPHYWYEGYFLSLNISENNKISFDVHCYHQCHRDYFIALMGDNDTRKMMHAIKEVNDIIGDMNAVMLKWEEYAASTGRYQVTSLSFSSYFLFRVLKKLGLIRFFHSAKYEKRIINMLRCESHYELLLKAMDIDQKGDAGEK